MTRVFKDCLEAGTGLISSMPSETESSSAHDATRQGVARPIVRQRRIGLAGTSWLRMPFLFVFWVGRRWIDPDIGGQLR